jgi:hypothetical protein
MPAQERLTAAAATAASTRVPLALRLPAAGGGGALAIGHRRGTTIDYRRTTHHRRRELHGVVEGGVGGHHRGLLHRPLPLRGVCADAISC